MAILGGCFSFRRSSVTGSSLHGNTLSGYIKEENFFASCTTINVSRRLLLLGVP
jgi:hypothetical protein